MEWWTRMMVPMRRLWCGMSRRFGIRRTGGLLKLHHDVRACEYEDVRVMWQMLSQHETGPSSYAKSNKKNFWNILDWAKRTPKFRHSYR